MNFEWDWKIGFIIILIIVFILGYFYLMDETQQGQDTGQTRNTPPPPPSNVFNPLVYSPVSSLRVEPKIDITDDQLVYITLIVTGGKSPYKFFVERSPSDERYTFTTPGYQSEAQNIAYHNNVADGVYQYRIKDDESTLIYTPKIIISRQGDLRTYRFENN